MVSHLNRIPKASWTSMDIRIADRAMISGDLKIEKMALDLFTI
jgi:hypothetical protein